MKTSGRNYISVDSNSHFSVQGSYSICCLPLPTAKRSGVETFRQGRYHADGFSNLTCLLLMLDVAMRLFYQSVKGLNLTFDSFCSRILNCNVN